MIVEGPFPTSFGVQMAILCPDGVEKMSCGVSYNFFGLLMMLAFPIFGFHLPSTYLLPFLYFYRACRSMIEVKSSKKEQVIYFPKLLWHFCVPLQPVPSIVDTQREKWSHMWKLSYPYFSRTYLEVLTWLCCLGLLVQCLVLEEEQLQIREVCSSISDSLKIHNSLI